MEPVSGTTTGIFVPFCPLSVSNENQLALSKLATMRNRYIAIGGVKEGEL